MNPTNRAAGAKQVTYDKGRSRPNYKPGLGIIKPTGEQYQGFRMVTDWDGEGRWQELEVRECGEDF